MGGDNELRRIPHQVVHAGQKGQLPAGGKGGLRFIKNIKAIPEEAFHDQGHKGFTMGQFMQGFFALTLRPKMVKFGCHVIETFRPQKESVPGTLQPALNRKRFVKGGMAYPG